MLYLVREIGERGKKPDFRLLDAMMYYIDTLPERFHHPKEDRYPVPDPAPATSRRGGTARPAGDGASGGSREDSCAGAGAGALSRRWPGGILELPHGRGSLRNVPLGSHACPG